jgi:signal transduction histidine kinase
MQHSLTIEDDNSLLQLRSDNLQNFRKRRYLGDDLCLPLTAFVPEDQRRIRDLYDLLEEGFALFRDMLAAPSEAAIDAAGAFIRRQNVRTLILDAQQFGLDSHEAAPSELLAKTIHDLRGGGLTFLLFNLQIAQTKPTVSPEMIRSLFFLTRDHLKIMRNALLGLDDPKREEDLLPKLHGISFIVEKWQNALLHGGAHEVRLEVDSRFEGCIAECCVEFGALDRILYNLINNAARHAAGEKVVLTIVPLPERDTVDLRFILTNDVSTEDASGLRGRDLAELFKPGVSTTGSGFGMTVAADFVANAYGLSSRDRALREQYLGARLLDQRFAAWFHWPIAPDA